mgnify:FL=1
MKDRNYYIKCFRKLRGAPNLGGAPHKPILLLSVIDSYEAGLINSDRIYITAELMAYFKSNWQLYVKTTHTMNFSLPFFHLSREPFWEIITKSGYDLEINSKGSIKSFNALYLATEYAKIDKELAFLLVNDKSRSILKSIVIDKYFSTSIHKLASTSYLDSLARDILNESGESYRKKIEKIKAQMNNENYEEEIFMRGHVFQRQIPLIYNYTCCVSGYTIRTQHNISMIDSCHIVPFSESYNDTIANGLALCPNIHRAFDRGLITIDENYKVVISSQFEEELDNPFSIREFDNREILLPQNLSFAPDRGNLLWHNENVFRG